MRIAILSRNIKLYSTSRLKEAAENRGHEVDVIDYMKCYLNINRNEPSIHLRSKELPAYDAIIPRIGASKTFYGTAVVRQLETMDTYSINPSIAITRSRDKLRSHQILTMKGIDMPVTGIASSRSDIDDLIKMVGGPPLVIKLVEGALGVGVVLAETKKAAQSVMQTLFGLSANIIIQEYIKEAEGSDIRCFVVGDKVVAAMKRSAGLDDFRSNLHRGGCAEVISISKAERQMAIKAAKVMGLRMAGVDIIRSERGPLVLEVNSSPGLKGIETTSGVDVAGMIIRHIEKHAKPVPKRNYQG